MQHIRKRSSVIPNHVKEELFHVCIYLLIYGSSLNVEPGYQRGY